MRRSVWLALFFGVGCVCGGPDQPDGSIDAGSIDAGRPDGGGVTDAGAEDAGVDAGRPDAGMTDAGSDGGNDGGFDAGFDAGSPGCAQVVCPPWQSCVEAGGAARCEGTVTITWVSPIAGASAPMDLEAVPLAIDTNAGAQVDVPWTSIGVISAAGTFSGQTGIRSATLLLADADAGAIILTAGWPGGPQASTVLQLERPIVRVPLPPSYGTNTADFEPNDPAGPAFRRDDVVPIEVDELPQPMALFAKLDAPNARALAMPIVDRCDAGTCRRVTLDLKPLHFPAFRGRVLVWATAADGGLQTRPRSVPVTRWRWRRQVSTVPTPLSVTRPVSLRTLIAVGSSDTATTGNHLVLRGNGTPAMPSWMDWPAPGVSATAFTDRPSVFAASGAAGGQVWQSELAPYVRPSEGNVLACSSGSELTVCASDDRKLQRVPLAPAASSSVDSGCPFALRPGLAIVASPLDNALVSAGSPICVTRFEATAPFATESTTSTTQPYGRAFAALAITNSMLWASGVDGGIWRVERNMSTLTERLVWDGGLVDGIAAMNLAVSSPPGGDDSFAYWATADLRVHRARDGVPLVSEDVARVGLSERISTTPVLAYDLGFDGGAALFVSRNGAIAAYDADSLTRVWGLEPGDAGIRGGRVDTDPIGLEQCGHHGSLLVPSSGDGSLYDIILDGDRFSWNRARPSWCMAGRTPENETILQRAACTPD